MDFKYVFTQKEIIHMNLGWFFFGGFMGIAGAVAGYLIMVWK